MKKLFVLGLVLMLAVPYLAKSNGRWGFAIIPMTFLMLAYVLGIRKKLKILNPIIKCIFINMMNNFRRFKFATNMLTHYKSMFINPFIKLFSSIFNFYINIRFAAHNMYSFTSKWLSYPPNNRGQYKSAFIGTALNSISITRINMKNLIANYAIFFNSFMVSILAFPGTIFSKTNATRQSNIFFVAKFASCFCHIVIVYILLGFLASSNPVMASGKTNGKIGWEITKIVNAGYEVSMIADQNMDAPLPFNPTSYIRTKLAFTAPRGDIGEAIKSLDHDFFQLAVGGGIKFLGADLEFETSLVNHFAKAGKPEWLESANTARVLWNW